MKKSKAETSPTSSLLGEGALVAALLLAVIGLIVATWGSSSEKDFVVPLKAQEKKQVHVFIEGAVQFPGLYVFEKGACLSDLLDQAVPMPDADLKRFKQASVLCQGKKVTIPSKRKISIYISGDVVSPRWLQVPKGTRLCELPQYLPPECVAGISAKSFSKRRYLKDQDVVFLESHIPLESN